MSKDIGYKINSKINTILKWEYIIKNFTGTFNGDTFPEEIDADIEDTTDQILNIINKHTPLNGRYF